MRSPWTTIPILASAFPSRRSGALPHHDRLLWFRRSRPRRRAQHREQKLLMAYPWPVRAHLATSRGEANAAACCIVWRTDGRRDSIRGRSTRQTGEAAMADQIRRWTTTYVEVPDKPGEGVRVLGALQGGGCEPLSFTAFPPARARRRSIVCPPGRRGPLARAAKNAGLTLSPRKQAFLVQGADRRGGGRGGGAAQRPAPASTSARPTARPRRRLRDDSSWVAQGDFANRQGARRLRGHNRRAMRVAAPRPRGPRKKQAWRMSVGFFGLGKMGRAE